MKNDNEKLANRLFPDIDKDISFYSNIYPSRGLSSDSRVTRVAPSPTGYMHIGGLYMALVSKKIADQTNGVFFLRVEDTDKKREVLGTKEIIIKSLEMFDLKPNEGPTLTGEIGNYGPYVQSERMEIYKTFAKELVRAGMAYPCFATTEELEEIKKSQEAAKIKTGYYSNFALWRSKTPEDVDKMLSAEKPFVVRFKARNYIGKTIIVDDLIRGKITMPVNDQDFVLIKSDGLPTYHLAHLVDDYLMGTTDVLRADEWISSLPIHYALFEAFGLKTPRYGHISPIQKIDVNGNKRKLSKRKDPEATVEYYDKQGYPEIAVIEYLMNLADGKFEPWRKENPTKGIEEFNLGFSGLGGGGPLFDETKLKDIAKNVISTLNAEELYDKACAWSKKHDEKFNDFLEKNKDYSINVFGIERGGEKSRKDIACMSEIYPEFSFLFYRGFSVNEEFVGKTVLSKAEQVRALNRILTVYNHGDEKTAWFSKIQEIASEFNLASNIKVFKENPSAYRGQVGELTQLLRYVLSGREKTSDLYSIITVMGESEFKSRLLSYVNKFQ